MRIPAHGWVVGAEASLLHDQVPHAVLKQSAGRVTQRDAEGRAQRISGTIVEIDARKRAEEATRDAEERYRSLIELAPDGVVVYSDGLIEYANPAFCEMSGYTLEELIGQRTAKLKSGVHGPEFYRQLWNTITAGHPWRGEVVNRRKDGMLYHELLTIAPVMDEGGQVVRYVAVKHDITERKRIEQRLEHLAHFDLLTDLPNLVGADKHTFLARLAVLLKIPLAASSAARPMATTCGSVVKKRVKGSAKMNTSRVPRHIRVMPVKRAARMVSLTRPKRRAPLFWATKVRVATLSPMTGNSTVCSMRVAMP